jgi:hypothetical protein
MMSMLKVDDLYKDSYSTGTLNFDNGKITIGFKGYSGEKLTELYKKYKTEDINADMVKRFPGKDISAMLAISYRPEFFKDLITLTGTDGFVNLGLTKSGTGLTLDDIIKSQKGDVFIAATNVQNKPDTLFYGTGPNQYFVSNKPKADYIFSVSINDKAAFNNLIKTAQKLDEGRNMMIDSAVPKKPAPFVYASNDKYFVIGADKSYVDQYLAGGNNSYEFMKNLGGYPIGGYVNINSLIKSISAGNAKDSTDLQLVDLSLKMWQDAYVKGGKFTDGASTQNFEINLVDKNVNSLKQLIDYFDKIAVIEKKKSEQAMEKFRIEEETTAAPMAPVVPDAPVTKTPKHR